MELMTASKELEIIPLKDDLKLKELLTRLKERKNKFNFPDYLRANLHLILEMAIPNKWDAIGLVSGGEGSGKSTFASQICSYLDPYFNLDQVAFTPQQFMKCIEECDEERAILWDEAITGVNVAAHATEVSTSIVSKLTQIRRKRLKIILCFPYLGMLNKYLILRCLFHINVFALDFDKRGHFNFYSQNRTETIYQLMKERYRMNNNQAYYKIIPNFYGCFKNLFPLPFEAYEQKKELASMTNPLLSVNDAKWKTRFACLARDMKNKGATLVEIAKISKIHPNAVSLALSDPNCGDNCAHT